MIKGKLVGLRALEKEDLVLLRDWRNIASFRRNFREYRELNMVNQENWFARVNNSPNDFMFMIERLSDKKPMGACGLLYTNWIIRSADFSFYIGAEEKYIDNDGYAEEAASLLINYGFKNLNLHKIWMELYEFDHMKIKFFTEKFKFKVDGTLRDNCFEDGRYWNSQLISLLSEGRQ
ncbi:MAG TPA: GNAT family N-acetyltransferase [Cyclobacteriaceae bacterium]|nr:GNAT family N-acetyltransferase [Cyclobacteriaceae bacterium]